MSDEFERETQELGNAILAVYLLITRVCGLLPIPISLPDFEEDVLTGERMMEGVARLIDLIEDEPISEETQAGIWGSCIHWHSAAHLYQRWMEHHEHLVATEIRLNLVTAGDVLHAVGHELIDSQDE